MNITFDVAIIGSGVAGSFAAARLAQKHPKNKTLLLEFGASPAKRRRFLEGYLGSLPNGDGKLYTQDFDQVINIADGRSAKSANQWIMDILKEVNPMKLIKDKGPNPNIIKKIKQENYELKLNDYYQWKPDSIHQLSRILAEEIDNKIEAKFDTEVTKISKKRGVFTITSTSGEFQCKKIILCAGRSGWRWVNSLFKDLGLLINDDYAKFGIRLEMIAQHLKEFNGSHCVLSNEEIEVGPLSWAGTVIPEDHADLVISGFRSNEDRWKSDKVSFSLIGKRYFKDKGCYQTERLGKLAFLLCNDRINKERVKALIKKESQLSLLPEYDWLPDILNKLENVIPNIISRGYFYAPNIVPLASEIRLNPNLESELDGLFVAGESASFKGILAAAISGTIAADQSIK